jgi:hypothetical protein
MTLTINPPNNNGKTPLHILVQLHIIDRVPQESTWLSAQWTFHFKSKVSGPTPLFG